MRDRARIRRELDGVETRGEPERDAARPSERPKARIREWGPCREREGGEYRGVEIRCDRWERPDLSGRLLSCGPHPLYDGR